MQDPGVRLNKYLAHQGLCSRREADRLIQAGQVKVNGEIEINPARHVHSGLDQIETLFDSQSFSSQKVTLALYKPRGVVVTRSREEGTNVYQLLQDLPDDLNAIGRLDKDSDGLLLLTNDSSLPRYIIDAGNHCPKLYHVRVDRPIQDESLEKMRKGMYILGEKTKPAKVERLATDRFAITLVEGRNRQIRRMCRQAGHVVLELHRVSIGSVTLGRLAPGQWRILDQAELDSLKK